MKITQVFIARDLRGSVINTELQETVGHMIMYLKILFLNTCITDFRLAGSAKWKQTEALWSGTSFSSKWSAELLGASHLRLPGITSHTQRNRCCAACVATHWAGADAEQSAAQKREQIHVALTSTWKKTKRSSREALLYGGVELQDVVKHGWAVENRFMTAQVKQTQKQWLSGSQSWVWIPARGLIFRVSLKSFWVFGTSEVTAHLLPSSVQVQGARNWKPGTRTCGGTCHRPSAMSAVRQLRR